MEEIQTKFDDKLNEESMTTDIEQQMQDVSESMSMTE